MAPTSRQKSPATKARPAATKRRRADAERNIAAILDAAVDCLVLDPDARIGEIAQAAGVGRVTLYGHFSSRADLIDAVFARTAERANDVLGAVELTGDPRQSLAALVASSWQIIDQFRALRLAAERELPAEHIRTHHDLPLRRVRSLVERGRREGVFRTDVPAPWLVTTFFSVIHGAAAAITAGALPAADAATMITSILLGAYTQPGIPVPASPSVDR